MAKSLLVLANEQPVKVCMIALVRNSASLLGFARQTLHDKIRMGEHTAKSKWQSD